MPQSALASIPWPRACVGRPDPSTDSAPLRGSVSAETTDGYARLVFVLNEDVDASARIAGNVLILSFAKPVAVSVDSLPAQAPSYIGEARRIPTAGPFGSRFPARSQSIPWPRPISFVDLLPDTWRGPPPGLPQDVIAGIGAPGTRRRTAGASRTPEGEAEETGSGAGARCKPADLYAVCVRYSRPDLGFRRSR